MYYLPPLSISHVSVPLRRESIPSLARRVAKKKSLARRHRQVRAPAHVHRAGRGKWQWGRRRRRSHPSVQGVIVQNHLQSRLAVKLRTEHDRGVSEQSELVHAMPKNEIKSERRRQPRSMQGLGVYRDGGLCSASKIWGLPVEDMESG
jgi:hypothetical protein